MPAAVPALLPPGSRYTFGRDSMLWAGAHTLADLLETIPGVYVARTGFTGLPEYVFYAGRGAAALEIYWDGTRLEPLGQDSVYFDPATVPLNYLQRVDVVVGPAGLRVYLVTERHDDLQPRSAIEIVSGDFQTGGYAGVFQNRWPQGIGLNVGANVFSVDGASGANRSDQRIDLWVRGEWAPDRSTGVSYQVRRQRIQSDEAPGIDVPVGVRRRDGSRTDFRLDFLKSSSVHGSGLRLDLGVASSSWSDDSTVIDSLYTEQTVRSAHVGLGFEGRRLVVETRARTADRWLQAEYQSRISWMPVAGILAGGWVRRQQFEDDRTATQLELSLGLYGGPFSLVGAMSRADVVQAPAIAGDTVVETDAARLTAGLRTGWLSGSVTLVDRSWFQPLGLPLIPVLASLDSTPSTSTIEAVVSLQPTSYLTIDGWYSNPRAPIDLQPPTHGRVAVTFRSKFWDTFRSGAFDLVLRVSLNSWSRGTAGLDDTGAPIELKGISFYETHLQFRIVGFSAFWNLRNAYNAREDYVPGLAYPTNAQTFGVKWEFAN